MCLFCWSWYTCGFSTRCHVAGCPSGVPLLADPLRVAGRTGSAPLPPLDLVVVSASGVLGGGGGAPSSGPSGFRRWGPSPFRTLSGGCLSLHWQAWRDRGAEPWVVEVLRLGYCLPFLSTPPLPLFPSQCLLPAPLHHGGCSGGGRLGLHCHGCCGACSTHFSSLLQPSVHSVEDLEVMASGHRPLPSHSLCGCVSLPDGDHSVCAPGGASGGLDGLRRSDGSVPSSAGSSASRHFLRFLFSDTVYHFKALCFGLSTAPQVFTRVMAPVSAVLHSLGIRMRWYLDDWLVQSSSRESLLEDLQTVLQLCHGLGIVFYPSSPTWFLHRWFSIWGLSSPPPLSGLLRRWSASHGCYQQPQSFSPAPRLPRAYSCRYSASFLRRLTSFLATD